MPGPLDKKAVKSLLSSLDEWKIVKGELVKTFTFPDYYDAVAFVNATAWISNSVNHHPDIELGYNTVKMRYSTHSVGRLTDKDFSCAAKIDSLLTER